MRGPKPCNEMNRPDEVRRIEAFHPDENEAWTGVALRVHTARSENFTTNRPGKLPRSVPNPLP